MPRPLQCDGSEVTSTHSIPHSVRPVGQVGRRATGAAGSRAARPPDPPATEPPPPAVPAPPAVPLEPPGPTDSAGGRAAGRAARAAPADRPPVPPGPIDPPVAAPPAPPVPGSSTAIPTSRTPAAAKGSGPIGASEGGSSELLVSSRNDAGRDSKSRRASITSDNRRECKVPVYLARQLSWGLTAVPSSRRQRLGVVATRWQRRQAGRAPGNVRELQNRVQRAVANQTAADPSS